MPRRTASFVNTLAADLTIATQWSPQCYTKLLSGGQSRPCCRRLSRAVGHAVRRPRVHEGAAGRLAATAHGGGLLGPLAGGGPLPSTCPRPIRTRLASSLSTPRQCGSNEPTLRCRPRRRRRNCTSSTHVTSPSTRALAPRPEPPACPAAHRVGACAVAVHGMAAPAKKKKESSDRAEAPSGGTLSSQWGRAASIQVSTAVSHSSDPVFGTNAAFSSAGIHAACLSSCRFYSCRYTDPLCSFHLVKTKADEHFFFYSMHHAVARPAPALPRFYPVSQCSLECASGVHGALTCGC